MTQQSYHERLQLFIDNMPMGCSLRNRDFEILDCNQPVLNMFGVKNKKEYIARWRDLVPEHQPSGALSSEMMKGHIDTALKTGHTRFEWLLQKLDGTMFPAETTIICVKWQDKESLLVFVQDLSERKRSKTTNHLVYIDYKVDF